MDELERLRERNRELRKFCQTCCELLSGMMNAAAIDNPELLEVDHYVRGMKQFEEMSLYLRETKGEG